MVDQLNHLPSIINIYRTDPTNVGDWYCAPSIFFPSLGERRLDILDYDGSPVEHDIVLGGGGLIARTFHERMANLAAQKLPGQKLVAWGIGESENVDRAGGFVLPYNGPYPAYLDKFDLVGVRDYGTRFPWVPCVSCMLDTLNQPKAAIEDFVIYEHKRIKIPLDEPFPRMTNDGCDIEAVINFLSSGNTVITNSYHGAYWATLLGRRVVAIPNMSKMYRFKHAPAICQADEWRRSASIAPRYSEALDECRNANRLFFEKVMEIWADN